MSTFFVSLSIVVLFFTTKSVSSAQTTTVALEYPPKTAEFRGKCRPNTLVSRKPWDCCHCRSACETVGDAVKCATTPTRLRSGFTVLRLVNRDKVTINVNANFNLKLQKHWKSVPERKLLIEENVRCRTEYKSSLSQPYFVVCGGARTHDVVCPSYFHCTL